MGDTQTGKTSLVKQLNSDGTNFPKNYLMTLQGAEVHTKTTFECGGLLWSIHFGSLIERHPENGLGAPFHSCESAYVTDSPKIRSIEEGPKISKTGFIGAQRGQPLLLSALGHIMDQCLGLEKWLQGVHLGYLEVWKPVVEFF